MQSFRLLFRIRCAFFSNVRHKHSVVRFWAVKVNFSGVYRHVILRLWSNCSLRSCVPVALYSLHRAAADRFANLLCRSSLSLPCFVTRNKWIQLISSLYKLLCFAISCNVPFFRRKIENLGKMSNMSQEELASGLRTVQQVSQLSELFHNYLSNFKMDL